MPELYRFGPVEIRPAERRVLVDGRPATLRPRTFDVLLALAQRHERLVSKDELLGLAWPGVVVEENNLHVQVSALRRLLGAKAIATIPGRGYRFTLPHTGDPLASVGVPPAVNPADCRLPTLPVRLLGREDDLVALARLLRQHRLVTVVGTAGIGKTSLAIAAANECSCGAHVSVVWVELAPVSEPAQVSLALVQALNLQLPEGVDGQAAALAALRCAESLLVLDNAEHVVEAVASLADAILAAAPRTVLLVTSRSPLKLKQERIFRLGPLAVPVPGVSTDRARSFGAISLLESRVQALDRRFVLDAKNTGAAIEICQHVDGIPLAIELAAARVPLLGARAVADRLAERFRLLSSAGRDVPERHQTLLAALDWSHELLTTRERKVLYRLGLFTGGFSLPAATSVAGANATDDWAGIDALGALVDRSLVEVDAGATPRYRLLECVREYALLKLRAQHEELHAAHRAHARAMLEIFEVAQAQSWTESEAAWHSAYGPDVDNVRAALAWSSRHDRRMAVALAGAAHSLFVREGLFHELRSWCERADPLPKAVAQTALARYWMARSEATMLVQRAQALRFASKAGEIYRRLKDDRGLYLASSYAVRCAQQCESRRMLNRMKRLENPAWPPRLLFFGRRAETHVAMLEGRDEDKGRLLEDMLRLARACDAPSLVERTLANMADHALAIGDRGHALQLGRELFDRLSG
ncbi:MAG TPA: winged helix-turn-helix domain-containing protein, partial [Usitatibacter sp.]|nr:winged helix-turn-helix domain-containing protein [Usitatibacter sp.]